MCGACADRVEPTPAEVLTVEVAWLARSGESPELIAGRLGYRSPASLERQLYRLGRPDLVAAMKDRQP